MIISRTSVFAMSFVVAAGVAYGCSEGSSDSTLSPKTSLRLVMKGDYITIGEGDLVYGLMSHTAAGDAAPGLTSMDLRSTEVDVSALAGQRTLLDVAAQFGASGQSTHSSFVNIKGLDSFVVDENYVVFPRGTRRISRNGPFVTFVFHRRGSDDRPEPLRLWAIELQQNGQTISTKLSSDGSVDLVKVTRDPIRCVLREGASATSYEYTAFPAIRGAVEKLVSYRIWNVTDATRAGSR